MFELDPLSVARDIVVDIVSSSKEKSSSDCSSFTDQASICSFVDLDPEIIEAKCKWSRNDFTKNQVWAVYDGPHSMPQRYVVVNNAISDTEVCTVFLEPHPKLEDEIYWVGENLPFVCGLFEVGRTTIMRMSQLSHVVTCEMNIEKSLYRIYPKKGDILAMYKNWHPKWKNCDYQSHQCQIVEVLSDFSEGADMKIASLLEVDDYVTFFRRQQCNGFEFIRVIPRSKMLSFSHQIPCFVVARIEDHEFPNGALHIEPDALPRQQKNLLLEGLETTSVPCRPASTDGKGTKAPRGRKSSRGFLLLVLVTWLWLLSRRVNQISGRRLCLLLLFARGSPGGERMVFSYI